MSFSKLTKSIAIISAAVALMSPFSSHADTARSEQAMDACVAQFVAAQFPDRVVKVRKEDALQSPVASLVPRSAHTIHLSAKGRVSGAQLASATCVVNDHGVVLSLHTPEKGHEEKVAAL